GKWSVQKQIPKEIQAPKTFTASTAPTRVSRTIVGSQPSSNRVVTTSRDSSISYDPIEHRYVNSNPSPAQPAEIRRDTAESRSDPTRAAATRLPETPVALESAKKSIDPAKPGITQTPAAPPRMTPPPRPPATPAPARTAESGSTQGSSAHGSSAHGSS